MPSLTTPQLTAEQNSICTPVSVSGNGKPPILGSSMYLLSLHNQDGVRQYRDTYVQLVWQQH